MLRAAVRTESRWCRSTVYYTHKPKHVFVVVKFYIDPILGGVYERNVISFFFFQCETVTTLPEVSRRRGLCNQGALVVANADFVCYSIKSNIRVIHRPTGARALIKLVVGSKKATPQV